MRALLSSLVHRLIFFFFLASAGMQQKGHVSVEDDAKSTLEVHGIRHPGEHCERCQGQPVPMSQGGSSWELPFDLSRMEKPRKNW